MLAPGNVRLIDVDIYYELERAGKTNDEYACFQDAPGFNRELLGRCKNLVERCKSLRNKLQGEGVALQVARYTMSKLTSDLCSFLGNNIDSFDAIACRNALEAYRSCAKTPGFSVEGANAFEALILKCEEYAKTKKGKTS